MSGLWITAMAPLALVQSDPDLSALRAEISLLRAQQQQIDRRLAELEAQLPADTTTAPPKGQASTPVVANVQEDQQNVPGPASAINPTGASSPGLPPKAVPSKLAISGDLRVRYEANFGDPNAPARDRTAIRGRLRAIYALDDRFAIGGGLVTGDGDDPNSSDQTLGNFDDDLGVSLDQAYVRGTFGGLTLTAGKIPQPFVRTELVWDGDVNPQGVAASYRLPLADGGSLRTNALYFLIDEAAGGRDSRMIGGQVHVEIPLGASVKLEGSASYYDYRLASLAGGDAGDFRTNRFADGRYLSDFNLVDVIAAMQIKGFGERWPIRIVADYVHNLGATVDQGSGFGIDLLFGRGTVLHDWRVGYGYAEVGVDAVFAAFSQDNTNLATNYKQHSALVDYVIRKNLILNATFYRYKAKSPLFTPAFSARHWAERLRVSLLLNF